MTTPSPKRARKVRTVAIPARWLADYLAHTAHHDLSDRAHKLYGKIIRAAGAALHGPAPIVRKKK